MESLHRGMPKGFFTRGVCLLLSRQVTLDELEPLLAEFKVANWTEAAESAEIAGPGLMADCIRETSGCVT
jgi:hypothetical protein